jgi:hypothetical protein
MAYILSEQSGINLENNSKRNYRKYSIYGDWWIHFWMMSRLLKK